MRTAIMDNDGSRLVLFAAKFGAGGLSGLFTSGAGTPLSGWTFTTDPTFDGYLGSKAVGDKVFFWGITEQVTKYQASDSPTIRHAQLTPPSGYGASAVAQGEWVVYP